MTAIDSFTTLSPRFYAELLRAGDRARGRGQHYRERCPDGSTTLRLSGTQPLSCIRCPPPTPILNVGRRKSVGVTIGLPFRTVAVVPRSHSNGMFERHRGVAGAPCDNPDVVAQAVPLDLRPGIKGNSSALVAWDSRLLTGYVRVAKPERQRMLQPFCPGLLDGATQGRTLAEEGYAALAGVLQQEDVDEALHLLLLDIQLLEPSVLCLGDVRKRHLPPERRGHGDLRDGIICHGKFACFLQSRPSVARSFERLLGLPAGAPIASVVSAVALAPPAEGGSGRAGRPALRLGFSSPKGCCWKACLQLFCGEKSAGGMWERIAVMFCMAPAVELPALCADRALLSCFGMGALRKRSGGHVPEKNHQDKQLVLLASSVERSDVIAMRTIPRNSEEIIHIFPDRSEHHLGDPAQCVQATNVSVPRPSGVLKRPHLLSAGNSGCSIATLFELDLGVAESNVPAKRSKTCHGA